MNLRAFLPARTRRARAWLAAFFVILFSAACWGQDQAAYDADRTRALELTRKGAYLEALPILERLAAANPKDVVVHERLGSAILANAATMSDPEARRQERMRARKALLEAKELGDTSDLLVTLLEGLPEDGREGTFSSHQEAEKAMREGEAAFARSDFEKALAAYQRALLLDPKLYEAALFLGDVYYAQKDAETAGAWFSRAIAIDPDKETAYRYWGDALMNAGKATEAREKFIDGILAAPYTQQSWMGLGAWARTTGVTLSAPPKIDSPNSIKEQGDKTNITLDFNSLEAKDGRNRWMMYEITRAAWRSSLFAKEFPKEPAYRHSLREETAALRAVATLVEQDLKEKKIQKLDAALGTLIELDQKGLLEVYVLFVRPDEGIAKDYPAYREAHRDLLRRFITEYVLPKGQ